MRVRMPRLPKVPKPVRAKADPASVVNQAAQAAEVKPPPPKRLAGQTALVTGASSGLGAEFARLLAAEGANLIIVARRRERLMQLRDDIQKTDPVAIDVVAMDLSLPDAARSLFADVTSWGKSVDVLINNAGRGMHGLLVTQDPEEVRAMLQLNVLTATELTQRFAKDMQARGHGTILMVASLAGHQATPYYAAYGGSKAHLVMLGEALNVELRGSGVSVTVLSPGATATEFLGVAGHRPGYLLRLFIGDSAVVARAGLNGMLARRSLVIPGLRNKLMEWAKRLFPRAAHKWVAWLVMRPW